MLFADLITPADVENARSTLQSLLTTDNAVKVAATLLFLLLGGVVSWLAARAGKAAGKVGWRVLRGTARLILYPVRRPLSEADKAVLAHLDGEVSLNEPRLHAGPVVIYLDEHGYVVKGSQMVTNRRAGDVELNSRLINRSLTRRGRKAILARARQHEKQVLAARAAADCQALLHELRATTDDDPLDCLADVILDAQPVSASVPVMANSFSQTVPQVPGPGTWNRTVLGSPASENGQPLPPAKAQRR